MHVHKNIDPTEHCPVLLSEAMAGLRVRPRGLYVDATFGRGGHSKEICLKRPGRLLALDRDPEAAKFAREHFIQEASFEFEQVAFSNLSEQVAKRGWLGRIDGILLDLGISSPQVEDSARGFSFSRSGPLDMRMDPTSGESASEWLARVPEQELIEVLYEFGEERYAKRIARAIVTERSKEPLLTTGTLSALVAKANPRWERERHPATRTFQAIRIFINQELAELEAVLPQAVEALAPGGRLVVISFHSLEDRIVKRFIRHEAKGEPTEKYLPMVPFSPRLREVGKKQKPGTEEIEKNPRARSAILRVAEKLED